MSAMQVCPVKESAIPSQEGVMPVRFIPDAYPVKQQLSTTTSI